MSILDDANAAHRKVIEDFVDGLQKEVAAKNTTISQRDAEIASLKSENVTLKASSVSLKAEIETLKARIKELEDTVVVPPPTTNKTLIGASITGNLGGWKGDLPVARVFLQLIKATDTWYDINKGLLRKAEDLGAKVMLVSWKETNTANVEKFLKTKPDHIKVYGCYHHEPENGDFANPKTWRDKWAEMGPAIRRAGCIPTSILMRWTLNPASGRTVSDWVLPKKDIDVFGIDAYGGEGPTYYKVSDTLGPVVKIAKDNGWGWAVGEAGSTLKKGTSQARATWAAQYAKYCIDNEAAVACWWDAVDGGYDATLDANAANAWFGQA